MLTSSISIHHEEPPMQKNYRTLLLATFFSGIVFSGIVLSGIAVAWFLLASPPQALAQEKVEQSKDQLRFPPELIWENLDMKADAVSISVSPNGKELFVAVIDRVEGLRVVHIPTSRH